jgi:23S rRNA (guanine1835-N2)-methyltransferase
MNNRYETPYGIFSVSKTKEKGSRSDQAWNSADLYILDQIQSMDLTENSSVLILNDEAGALTIPLCFKHKVYYFNDSLCSYNNSLKNLQNNRLEDKVVDFLTPDDALPENIDLIVIKNPKSLNYLEFELQLISSAYPEGIPVIAADMTKNVHSSTVSLFEHYLGDAKTSLAWKKSRLILGKTSGKKEVINEFPVKYKPLDETFELVNYPNLFAFGRLDPGTAFLLSNFPYVASRKKVIDLGCGDGVIAMKAASKWPEAEILCVEESYLAIKSAKESFSMSSLSNKVEFRVTDILNGIELSSADLILCNPPFHDNLSLSTATALEMFRQSAEVLKEGGELFVIANKHLGYEKHLGKMFSKAQIIKSNKKFSIIRAVK